jgi:hypothetical protein
MTDYNQIQDHDVTDVNPVIQLMANMINYLNVSLYEGQFTLTHEQSRRRLNEIYDTYATNNDPSIKVQPTLYDIKEFYKNVNHLRNVTETDDPDYNYYMRSFCRHIRRIQTQQQ